MRKNRSILVVGIFLLAASISYADETTKSLTPGKSQKYPAPPMGNGSRDSKKDPVRMLPSDGYVESDSTVPQSEAYNMQTVLPESPTSVVLSSSDLNRISCNEPIKDALSSAEKGAIIKIVGKDAFLKFSVLKSPEGKIKYTTTPTEIFIVCGDSTYNLVAYPKKVPSKTIKLGTPTINRIKANQSIFSTLPFEKKILRAIKDVYTEQIPESYQISTVNRSVGNYRQFTINHRRSIQIEGEGLTLHEFNLQLKQGQIEFKLNEKLFVNKIYAPNIVAICPEHNILYPGETTRLFLVEQRSEKNTAAVTSLKLEDESPSNIDQAKDNEKSSSEEPKVARREGSSSEN